MDNKKKKAVFIPETDQTPKTVDPVDVPRPPLTLADMEAAVLTHWKQIAIGLGIVIAVICAGAIVQHVLASADRAARARLAAPKTAEEFAAAIAADADHQAAIDTRLRYAQLLIGNKDYEKAAAVLEEVALSSRADLYIRVRAELDRAYLLEQLGKKDQALAEFSKIAGNFAADEVLRAEASCAEGRLLLQAGDLAGATKAIARVNLARLNNGEQSYYQRWAYQAQELAARIKAATPKTAPAAPAAPAVR